MSVRQKKNPPPLFLTDNIKMDNIPTKIKWKIHALFKLYFKFILKVLLRKICKTQPPDRLFLVVFISLYISRYHFSQIFRTSSTLSEKKLFVTNFPFLIDSLRPPTPNGQNPLAKSVTTSFFWCSLTIYQSEQNKHRSNMSIWCYNI